MTIFLLENEIVFDPITDPITDAPQTKIAIEDYTWGDEPKLEVVQ